MIATNVGFQKTQHFIKRINLHKKKFIRNTSMFVSMFYTGTCFDWFVCYICSECAVCYLMPNKMSVSLFFLWQNLSGKCLFNTLYAHTYLYREGWVSGLLPDLVEPSLLSQHSPSLSVKVVGFYVSWREMFNLGCHRTILWESQIYQACKHT